MSSAGGAFAYGAPKYAVCGVSLNLAGTQRQPLTSVPDFCRLLFDRKPVSAGRANTTVGVEEILTAADYRSGQRLGVFAAGDVLIDFPGGNLVSEKFTGAACFLKASTSAFKALAAGVVDLAVVIASGAAEVCSIAFRRFEDVPHPLAVMSQMPVGATEFRGRDVLKTISLVEAPWSPDSLTPGEALLPWCQWDANPSRLAASEAVKDALSVAIASLSLHHKILPGTAGSGEHESSEIKSSAAFYESTQARPWVSPVSPLEEWLPRRACALVSGGAALLLHEFDQGLAPEHVCLVDRPCELFVFRNEELDGLVRQLQHMATIASEHGSARLCDLSWSLNVEQASQGRFRAAVIAESVDSLVHKVVDLCEHIFASPAQEIAASVGQNRGIYYNAGKCENPPVAFVLPGLGAAYPDMLLELCTHFPEVRQVFDYVDRLAFKDGERILPSSLIFPVAPNNPWGASTTASLAAMDSAVVLVLLAEYALYTLLKNLNIAPGALVGCSTGEFAVLTMSGSVNILEAAETFYKLSTAVSRSVPASELERLRTLVVSAPSERLRPLMDANSEPVYLGADMTDSYVIVSGADTAIESFSHSLKAHNIAFLPLPMAIPYHTPLVAGKVSAGQQDVRDLPMRLPTIEMWSCSFADKYPNDVAAIREISTNLFEHPILLKTTIERMYAQGIRTFLEVGPKGAVAPLVSDILKKRPHASLAMNVIGRSAIGQLQHVLASLIMFGSDVNLAYIYRHNAPRSVLSFCPGNGDAAKEEAAPASKNDGLPEGGAEQDAISGVMQSFLDSLAVMHSQVLALQQQSMLAYLQSSESEDDFMAFEKDGSEQIVRDSLDLVGLPEDVTVSLVRGQDLPSEQGALNLLVEDLFDEIDQSQWLALRGTCTKRARDWLLGRLAAKGAIRQELLAVCGRELPLRDISVRSLANGSPVFVWEGFGDVRICISISHREDVAVAVASRSWQCAGVDLEVVTEREDGFAVLAFSTDERKLLQGFMQAGISKSLIETIIWSAREAMAKAQGIGEEGSLRAAQVRAVDLRNGLADLQGRDGLAGRVRFWQLDGMILSVALLSCGRGSLV